MELILMDENNTRMQATCRMALVNQFKDKLVEGGAVTIERYSLGEIQPKYRMVNNAMRLSFLSNTSVEPCPDFTGSLYGFDFRNYRSITDLQIEEDGQFDVIGHVTACEDLDNYDKNGSKGKKKPLTLSDAEGNELKCTLWGVYAQQFNDFLKANIDHNKIMVSEEDTDDDVNDIIEDNDIHSSDIVEEGTDEEDGIGLSDSETDIDESTDKEDDGADLADFIDDKDPPSNDTDDENDDDDC